MGWDAFADDIKGHEKEFQRAYRRVRRKGNVDFGLRAGWLDCSACAREMEVATGESCWSEIGWSAEKVKQLAVTARWREDHPDDESGWALRSAREFLETCAKIGTGIHFNW